MNIIDEINKEQIKEIPEFSPGDEIVVQVRVKEGERERLQAFEGVVIALKNRGFATVATPLEARRCFSSASLLGHSPCP